MKFRWDVAIAIVIAAGVGFWYVNNNKRNSSQSGLARAHYVNVRYV